jgi:hypothetical protein
MRVRAPPAEGQHPDLAERPWKGQGCMLRILKEDTVVSLLSLVKP